MLKISSQPEDAISPEMKVLLDKIQKNAISLSVDMSELISTIKKLDPEYAAQLEEMEKA